MNEEFYLDPKKQITYHKYISQIYLYPLIASILIGIFFYFSLEYFNMKQNCIKISIIVFIILNRIVEPKWVPIVKGKYYYIGDLSLNTLPLTLKENNIITNYYNNKVTIYTHLLLGIFLIISGIFLTYWGKYEILELLLGILWTFTGAYFIYTALKELVKKVPILTITMNGIWTEKLGFINWTKLDSFNVTHNNELEIWLNYSIYKYTEYPAQSIKIKNLVNYETLELSINNAKKNYYCNIK